MAIKPKGHANFHRANMPIAIKINKRLPMQVNKDKIQAPAA